MNNFDVAGILTTYAQKAQRADSTRKLRDLIKELKSELDLRTVHMEDNE